MHLVGFITSILGVYFPRDMQDTRTESLVIIS